RQHPLVTDVWTQPQRVTGFLDIADVEVDARVPPLPRGHGGHVVAVEAADPEAFIRVGDEQFGSTTELVARAPEELAGANAGCSGGVAAGDGKVRALVREHDLPVTFRRTCNCCGTHAKQGAGNDNVSDYSRLRFIVNNVIPFGIPAARATGSAQ